MHQSEVASERKKFLKLLDTYQVQASEIQTKMFSGNQEIIDLNLPVIKDRKRFIPSGLKDISRTQLFIQT